MLANKAHPKVASERLGHSDMRITLNRSSHLTPDTQRDSADRLDTLIGEPGRPQRDPSVTNGAVEP